MKPGVTGLAAPTLIIFGGTGSLATTKLVPALYRLHRKGRLPPATRLYGVARQDLDDEAFRDLVRGGCERAGGAAVEPRVWDEFTHRLRYVPGDVTTGAGLAGLVRALGPGPDPGARLFYLALAPALYPKTIDGLLEAGLAGPDAGGVGPRRIVVEKPFGHDLGSALALNRKLLSAFDESEIFRIDHFLGKETVQNLLVFRFANLMFEPLWNRNYIDHVQITVAESGTVDDRGAYYDGAGVLRDMFQNHLMQLLCLVTIEAPARFEAGALRSEKVKLLSAVRRSDEREARRHMVTGQYAGYQREPGVRRGSRTPTYAALRLCIDNWRWQGVPFYLRSGKGLATRVSEIVVQLSAPPHNMFDLPRGRSLDTNRISLGIQPDEGVHIRFETKVPDRGMEVRSSTLAFHFADQAETAAPDAYERLLLDALAGDASLFMREDEIEQAWSIIDPFTGAQEDPAGPGPVVYPRGSWGPAEADRLIDADGRAWVLESAAEPAARARSLPG